MERVAVIIDNGSGLAYDAALMDTLPECADLTLITKDGAMESGAPGIMVTFTVRLPDGSLRRVQAVTSLRVFLAAVKAIKAKYGEVI